MIDAGTDRDKALTKALEEARQDKKAVYLLLINKNYYIEKNFTEELLRKKYLIIYPNGILSD